jgi:hypothetical protein
LENIVAKRLANEAPLRDQGWLNEWSKLIYQFKPDWSDEFQQLVEQLRRKQVMGWFLNIDPPASFEEERYYRKLAETIFRDIRGFDHVKTLNVNPMQGTLALH